MSTSTHYALRVPVRKWFRLKLVNSTASPSGPAPAGRAAWGTISREQVIEMATRVVVERGFQRLTIRHLAAELGVAPMSLYRHVHSKNDLLNEVVDRMLSQAWRPASVASDDWRHWIGEAADKLRHFLIEQPAALHVYLSHPVVSPTAITRMEAVMTVLRGALGDERRAQQAYAAIHTYTIGFAALESSRAASPAPTDVELAPLATQLASYTSAEQFTTGLDYLIRGFAPPLP